MGRICRFRYHALAHSSRAVNKKRAVWSGRCCLANREALTAWGENVDDCAKERRAVGRKGSEVYKKKHKCQKAIMVESRLTQRASALEGEGAVLWCVGAKKQLVAARNKKEQRSGRTLIAGSTKTVECSRDRSCAALAFLVANPLSAHCKLMLCFVVVLFSPHGTCHLPAVCVGNLSHRKLCSRPLEAFVADAPRA